MATMPNVVGLEFPDALTAMVTAGVRAVPLGYFQADPVIVNWVKSSTVKPYFVTAQFPSSGTPMAVNAAALLNVSSPPIGVANYGGVGS